MDENRKKLDAVPLKSQDDFDKKLQEISGQEQLYSIALFDILGFSNFVQKNGTDNIMELYTKLLELVHRQESSYDGVNDFAGSVAPVPVSRDWKNNHLIANANGYVQVCHFSDTFVIYVNYMLNRQGWLLANQKYEPFPLLIGETGTEFSPIFFEKHHIFISFLQICMDFFCQSIIEGIPLRGCISTGFAVMDSYKSIYFGNPLVEAARGEPAQNALGVAFGKSYNNYHPVYNDYYIPYLGHIKKSNKKKIFLSPMMLDWARYWRMSSKYKDKSFIDYVNKMNTKAEFALYYDNAIKFYDFSKKHADWAKQINRENMGDITDYYNRVIQWYNSII